LASFRSSFHFNKLAQRRLGAAFFRLVIIFPAHQRRHRHQNRLRAPAGLQAEQRAAIPHQIELHVAAAAIELKLALALAVRRGFTAFDDGQIGVSIAVPDRLHKGEAVVKIRGVQVVKEQTADAALLVAVLEIEVVIAPFFIARIDFFAERQTQIAGGTMPVDGILFKAVVRG
jgi:hypothetical protein